MKTSLKFLAVAAFVSTLLLNLSFDSSGHFKLISQAKATSQTWKQVYEVCPDGRNHYTACLAGSDASCSPTFCTVN